MNNIKICQRCRKEFIVDKSKGNSGKYCGSCRTIIRRQKIAKKAVDYLGGKCIKCGYNKDITALEFHHRNPEEKSFAISSCSTSKKWEIVQKELDKCDLLCANCHREIHAEDDIPLEIYQKYITPMDEIVKISQKKKQEKIKREQELLKFYNNLNIDEIFSSKIYQRKVKRPDTYEQFKKEMEELNWNYCAMGRKYGVSDNTIRKWEKTYKKYGF